MREALNLGHRKPIPELRSAAAMTFKTRSPEEFLMVDEIRVATAVVGSCRLLLEEIENEQINVVRVSKDKAIEIMKKKKQEIMAIIKFIVTAQRNLQEGVVKNCQRMMSSLRRIVEFNQLAENVVADFKDLPLPHECVVDQAIKRATMYEVPPGDVPPLRRGAIPRPDSLRHSTPCS
ncbi:hypothetical protein PMAYCL1PPCAC_13096, partial [Pristionchus mayeri]